MRQFLPHCPWVALACLLVFAPACNTQHDQGTPQEPEPAQDQQALTLPQVEVSKKEFTCVSNTTASYLQGTSGAGAPKPLASYVMNVNAAALVQKIQSVQVANGEKRGLVIHYGMEDAGLLRPPHGWWSLSYWDRR